MDKNYFLAILTIAAIAGAALIFAVQQGGSVPEEQISRPAPGHIHSTQIYLIDSNLSYGTFKDSYVSYMLDKYFYVKGDRCVVVRGTIRNDGADDSWIGITTRVYDKSGQSAGTVITKSAKPWFQSVFVESNGTESFEIPVKYGKKDVTRYEFALNWGPDANPPP